MSKPERRCGRMSYRPAAKPIRWSMKSAVGNTSSSWPADITSWAPRPEITSSLTRFRNTEASSYREKQDRLHVRYSIEAISTEGQTTMTAQELSYLNTALAAVNESIREEEDGSFSLCQLTPVRKIAADEIAAFALIYGVTVA